MSSNPRDIRRLAFQALYQLDARGDETPEVVLAGIVEGEDEDEGGGKLSAAERRKAAALAAEAFADRAKADTFMVEAAPGWPTHRQAAVDRAILRLAYHEMTAGKVHPKIAVNEAVELAKEFSTDKSPAFINGLLDKALKIILRERGEAVEEVVGEERPVSE